MNQWLRLSGGLALSVRSTSKRIDRSAKIRMNFQKHIVSSHFQHLENMFVRFEELEMWRMERASSDAATHCFVAFIWRISAEQSVYGVECAQPGASHVGHVRQIEQDITSATI